MSTVRMFNYIPECVDLLGAAKRILENYLKDKNIIDFPLKNVTYTIRYMMDETKIVFLVSYGKSWPNRCYDRNLKIYDDSVLSDEVIHMTNQFIFVIYQDRVLCSDNNKRNVILNLLHDSDKNFSCNLLAVSTSIDDFIKQVKSIESVSITATNDLFINEFLNPHWGDDLDEKEPPETTTIKMEFKRPLNEDYIINLYKKLRRPTYIKTFNIKGETSDGFISINEESVIAKEIFEFEKEEGYYEVEEIFKKV
ncbi:MAG: hypothetical protein IJ752_06970 [Alphaproteobacteria bacterium]|nr:hypothetical protein [Alphaproteobacteria bacterium]